MDYGWEWDSGLEIIFGGGSNSYFTGSDATETAFKSLSSDYDIIHLAVHGEADLEKDVNSRLIFKSMLDSLNDGELFVYELYNLKLNTTTRIHSESLNEAAQDRNP